MSLLSYSRHSHCSSCTESSVVVSRGNPSASLMLIGEAPGAKEDELGLPFVGRSGKVLDQMLTEDGLLPEGTELKEVHASLEALYQLLAGKVKKKPKSEFDD